MKERNTACFIGHRVIRETDELRTRLYRMIEELITNKKVDTFLFGSKSRFNDLCYELVTSLKEKYPQIKRVYVRAEFPVIDRDYERYLLERYEATYYPAKVVGAGKAAYVERNCEMLKESTFCVFYYEEAQRYATRKSGTQIAFRYALKQRKEIIKLP